MTTRVFLCRDPDGHFVLFASHGDEPTETEMGWMVFGTGRLIVDSPLWFASRKDLEELFPQLKPGKYIELKT